MPRYVIERTVPGVHRLNADAMKNLAASSNKVLHEMSDVQWEHSYVGPDKLFCVYIADDVAAVEEHATEGGFPCNAVNHVGTIIDPTTAELVG